MLKVIGGFCCNFIFSSFTVIKILFFKIMADVKSYTDMTSLINITITYQLYRYVITAALDIVKKYQYPEIQSLMNSACGNFFCKVHSHFKSSFSPLLLSPGREWKSKMVPEVWLQQD